MAAASPAGSFSVHTIMLVDDDPLYLRVISRVLGAAGYRVVTHGAGFGLSSAVREHRPDLILLDLSMPGLSGDRAFAALRELSARFSALNVPVIFHSGRAEAELAELAQRNGAAGYLCKPASPDELLETVRRVLSKATAASD